jgi:alanine-glyoxylate transaminase/serine-glyoxylate transaminase/serine-pyruvate transaminase
MNAVRIPAGIEDLAVRKRLLQEFNLEIGAGLGPLAGKVWRFGLMGHSCKAENVMLCLAALGSVLADLGHRFDIGAAEAAAHAAYADHHATLARRQR